MMGLKSVLMGGAAMSLITQTALAQTSPESDLVVDEVIEVTSKFQNSLVNRLPIEIEKVPYSIDVLDRDFIDERGFIRPLEALQTLPSVFLFGDEFSSGAPFFLVRGFEASILVNNRPESNSRGIGRRDNAFVERYEVLKGPASISLGPVLPGGIINTVTKLPTAERSFDFEVRGGSFGTFRVEADANTGEFFNGKLTARLTAAYENNEFANGIEDRQVTAIRPIIAAEFSPSTRARLSVAYRSLGVTPGLNFPVFRDGTIPTAFDNRTYFGPPSRSSTDGDDVFVDSEIQHEFLDDLKLTIRGSYQDTSFDYLNTQGFYSYYQENPALSYDSRGSFDERVLYVDGQLAWTNVGVDWVDVVIGGTYQDTDSDQTFLLDFQGLRPEGSGFGFSVFGTRQLDLINPDFTSFAVPVNFAEPNDGVNVTNNPFENRRLFSAYSEVNLQPTEWLNILAGVRFDDLRTTVEDLFDGIETVSNTDNVSFRIGSTLTPIEDINIYASFAESFIPQAGIVEPPEGVTGQVAVGPETARSIEVGVKVKLFDGRLTARAAVNSTRRKNVAIDDPNDQFNGFVITVDAQRNRGFELFLGGQVTDAIDFTLSYGYLDAELLETPNLAQEDVGATPTPAPQHTFSAYGSYTVQDGPVEGLKIGGGVRYISERFGTSGFGQALGDIMFPGYTLVDGYASYRINDNYKVQLNVNNLLDNEYLEETGNSGRTRGGFNFGEPRVILATLNASF
ncbi:MAG: TonB-dependent siderophore receptor [Sphingomonadales bacterium]